jgi:hypothetical protein
MRETRNNSQVLIGASALVFALFLVIAFVWTGQNKEAARNDPRVGTTSETSPRNPTPAPGGGSDKSGG